MAIFKTNRERFDSESSHEMYKEFIGEFSLDGDKRMHYDNRKLARVKLDGFDESMTKKLQEGFDLKKGINRAIKYDNTNTKLINLLKWMLEKKDKITKTSKKRKSIGADFVCRRGVLQDIMCSPYSTDGWIILATKFQGTIYLCEEPTDEAKEIEKNMSKRDKDNCRLGYKFEQYMTEGANTSDPVNENEQYNCVLKSTLSDHTLLYRAEVDGIDTDLFEKSPTDLSSFLELKTSKLSGRDTKNFNMFKMRKWWYQSYLAGIPRVVCGFRNDDGKKEGSVNDDGTLNHGIIKEIEIYNVKELPKLCEDCGWSDKVMLKCLNKFLSFVKEQVTKDDEKLVYQFTKEKGDKKKGDKGEVTCKCLESSEKTFLPEWYTNAIFQ